MTREVYESPRMDFEELAANEAVAGVCWGHHGDGKNMYTDIHGTGWVSFQIGGGSCDLNPVNVIYYHDIDSDGVAASSDQIKDLKSILSVHAKNGQNFNGEESWAPPTPGPDFS